MKKVLFSLLACVLVFASCKEDKMIDEPVLPLTDAEIIAQHFNFEVGKFPNYAAPDYPAHYNQDLLATSNTTSANLVTDAGATLGRVLFYDKKLSLNNTIACASCHKQELGFTDPAVFSEGFEGGLTGAHSMRLANTIFYRGIDMFWDRRADDLETQTIIPIQDEIEMGFTAAVGGMDSLVRKLAKVEYYPILFKSAFGAEEVTEAKIQLAIGQFIRSMVSTNSKFDAGYAQVYDPNDPTKSLIQDFPNFTPQENMGKALYMGPRAKCNSCHQAPSFALDELSHSNGLDEGSTKIFKAPSLKNIALDGAFMHDGRFTTLEEVIEHYNSGIQKGFSLDGRLRVAGQPLLMYLIEDEKDALVAFLKTMTDENFVLDTKFASPFR